MADKAVFTQWCVPRLVWDLCRFFWNEGLLNVVFHLKQAGFYLLLILMQLDCRRLLFDVGAGKDFAYNNEMFASASQCLPVLANFFTAGSVLKPSRTPT